MAEIIEPTLIFDMFQAGIRGGVLATRAIKPVFGLDNYDEFRRAGKKGKYIPEEAQQGVNRYVYDQVGKMVGMGGAKGEEIWKKAMDLANRTVDYARGIIFADQERQATLTTNIAWGVATPSSILEILTMPSKLIGEQLRYEQFRQLGLGLLCAEIISGDENGNSRRVLTEMNNFLEERLFIGKRGNPKNFHTFSYHTPGTNGLVGLSDQHPDPRFAEELWVKSLNYPVRNVGIRNSEGDIVKVVPVLYDQREKQVESAVIKAMQRSLKVARTQPNGGLIETSRWGNDKLGFRLVVMQGEYPLRDRVTANLEDLFQELAGFDHIYEIDQAASMNGAPDRVQFRRRHVYMKDLEKPLEVIVQTLKDYIPYLYGVGSFNPEFGMHDGPAHDLYKLRIVSDVAEYLWPFKIFGIDLEQAKKSASYEYATRLGRKQRIHPSPYLDLVA